MPAHRSSRTHRLDLGNSHRISLPREPSNKRRHGIRIRIGMKKVRHKANKIVRDQKQVPVKIKAKPPVKIKVRPRLKIKTKTVLAVRLR